MSDILQMIREVGIVPVVAIENAKDALNLGKALMAGGLPIAEITFRTAAAEESIKILSSELPDMLVGAGTVLTVEQAQRAIAAGAKFIVSPGFSPKVVQYCVENKILITPGINAPTQIEMALEFGLNVLKFFPAEASGGLAMLKAIAAPYGSVSFIPTGGIDQTNINTYLAFNKVVACGGSWMVKSDLISAGNFAEITRLTEEAMLTMLGFDLAHVGINETTESAATASANTLANLFAFAVKDGASSVFAGTRFELMKSPFLGAHGHLAISTNSIPRAVAYLKRKGVAIRPDTLKEKNGKPQSVYLDTEISGFAVHLLQK
ncbi:2-dehydro-3-deoxyphosphogluconate aldolase/4-hydroxy-2-oxoglutarate aldolase [Candidatus Moduliflexus flocculans]|uniref:2-dehydro-3-deoxy-phosphogluconate aldolase n=1 Tax=Candidatus Moduliflexus flocculans TaxID=1499966 RepID=A0A081BT02_9BACT|nr:2-dehydro-3-deoxyphosphogluconate aldolase/4-hydroxy-2-oxoglutarate aldolase [Candidatus Moduliflexus flocculans]